ncbi:MAG: RNA methyltransferase [Rhodospirillales bacterium]|nr:RNA methyltransferase [Alphaproteobacteria bacterium]MBL6948457.1 RNA methyltransferase [Rhodospirillales bacterium]
MRGYFAIGVEGISKAMNVGSLFRTAHAFDASFVFTVAANYSRGEGGKSDTSDAPGHVPFYSFPDIASMTLPKGCSLVGVELTDDAVELPSFRHPAQAAYVMGPERGSLSPEMTKKCEFVVKIPTRFCVNVGVAGAIIMYDRVVSLGQFPRRPISPGGPAEAPPEHVFGEQKIRNKMEKFRDTPPILEED